MSGRLTVSLILGAIALVIPLVVILAILSKFAQQPEYLEGHWTEPEDGFAPGELPQTDPRTTGLTTYIRGWQGPQVVYTRVGREWPQ